MGGGVGESQGEFSVGSELDDPAVVVDSGVMQAADGDEVVEVGVSAVVPPDDVVEFAAVVADDAARDRAAPIQRALGAVGEAGVAARVPTKASCVPEMGTVGALIVGMVVETGVDPVTPRFSGVCSAN